MSGLHFDGAKTFLSCSNVLVTPVSWLWTLLSSDRHILDDGDVVMDVRIWNSLLGIKLIFDIDSY